MMRERPELRGKLLIDDSWDWQIVDALKPERGDLVVRKSRYSGFCSTGLEATLRARKIRHLLFTGVATNVCVDATARDAYMLEFWPILVEDAMTIQARTSTARQRCGISKTPSDGSPAPTRSLTPCA